MNSLINKIEPQIYYLVCQVIASLLIAIVGVLIGLIIAWLFWGRRESKIIQAEKRVAELNALLDNKD